MMLKYKATLKNQDAGNDTWMITFADLLALLLTFFVLLYSMNSVELDKWKALVTTMTIEFNPNKPRVVLQETKTESDSKDYREAGLNLTYLQARFEPLLEQLPSFEGAIVRRAQGAVIISIPAKVLFERKSTTLQAGTEKSFQLLASALIQLKNKIRIAGYTDAVPISNGKFRSNWELSMIRARLIAGIMTDAGYKSAITVQGYADTANADMGIGSEYAERIDIVVLAEQKEKGPYALF